MRDMATQKNHSQHLRTVLHSEEEKDQAEAKGGCCGPAEGRCSQQRIEAHGERNVDLHTAIGRAIPLRGLMLRSCLVGEC